MIYSTINNIIHFTKKDDKDLSMLIDTHCHINMLVKETFDIPLNQQQIQEAGRILQEALNNDVSIIINVGTSLIESKNCISLSQAYSAMYTSIGIHPNDCTQDWKTDFKEFISLLKNKEKFKIIALGETGLDRHYPGYNIMRQKDAFKAHIELALEHNLPLIIHTRDAHDEVLTILDEYKCDALRGVIHCFSENLAFAQDALKLNFVLGIGGTLTYPKNIELREVFTKISLDSIILETDAPFLPPQEIRGKKNYPKYIKVIAEFLAELRNVSFQTVAEQTTATAKKLFNITV